MKTLMLFGAAALLGGCATIVEGRSQTVTLLTEPDGAACHLNRDGEIIGVVNPTPGTVTVSKSAQNIDVRCELAGHQEGFVVIDSRFQGMTAGNILFGGVIGLGVDAASGAMHHSPDQITVNLRQADSPPAAPAQPSSPLVSAAEPVQTSALARSDALAACRADSDVMTANRGECTRPGRAPIAN